MIAFISFLLTIASAKLIKTYSTKDHIFGINGCEATPMDRVQVEEPVSEFFYSLQIDRIPNFEYNKEAGTVKLPMGKLLTGWYYHVSPIFDLVDAGVMEWFFFPNPSSLFAHSNYGAGENLMTVMKDGSLEVTRKQILERMAREEPQLGDDDGYVWKNADRKRRFKVNTHGAMTMAQKQFASISFDQTQTDFVLANPEPVPDFDPLQDKLKDALKDVNFPLLPAEGTTENLKVATNCLHGKSPDFNEEYFTIELNKETVQHKGQAILPLKLWANVAGRSYWKVDEEKGTLELYFRGFQMGYLNAKNPKKELKYYQAPPHTRKDNRVNEYAPKWGNPALQQPFCSLPAKIRKMKEDVHMFWQPIEVVCPPEKLAKFEKLIMEADFTTLVKKKNLAKETKLITAATDYVMCGGRYLRDFVKYSHGYDFIEAGAFLHFLIEFYPPFVVPFLTHKDLSKFKVDYIYGKEAPEHALGAPSISSESSSSESSESTDESYTLDTEHHLKEMSTDSEWSKEETWSMKQHRDKDAVAMVEGGQGSFVLQTFSFIGFGVLLYGSYAYYCGDKPGDNTRLEMA